MRFPALRSALLPLLALALAAPLPAKVRPDLPGAQHLAAVALTIRTAHGLRRFRVEVARSEPEQERGLMFRTALTPREGMIFPMDPPRPATFWMKNTVIPLDMVFIRADGTIARIAANATPYSLAPVDSGEPVAAVLEIAGGAAARQGIATGDRVDWRP